jgi:histidinol-phosphate aminotransferase
VISAVAPRADLADLPGYVPGGKILNAMILAGDEVPYAPPPTVSALGFDEGQIAIGSESVRLCEQLVQEMCTADNDVVFGRRSFEANLIVTRVVEALRRAVRLSSGCRWITIGMSVEHIAFRAAARAFPD